MDAATLSANPVVDAYAIARKHMVDGQLRPSKVTDPVVLAAFGALPREAFLPAGLAARAYTDEDVALPGGRAVMEPVVLARLLQLAAIRPGDRVLVVAAGTGYGAAAAAHAGARVTAVESDAALLAMAQAALAQALPAGAVRLEQGDATQGFAGGAPYDAVLIEGAVAEIPAGIVAQLAEGGRVVTVLGQGGRGGRAVLGRRIGESFTVTPVFDCAVPALPAFQPAPAFVF